MPLLPQPRQAVHHEAHALPLVGAQLGRQEAVHADGAHAAQPLGGFRRMWVEYEQRLGGGGGVGCGLLSGYDGVQLAEEVLERQQRRAAHAQRAARAQLAAVVGQGALRREKAEGRRGRAAGWA